MALIIKGDMPTKECLNCFDCQYLNLSETSYFNNRQAYRVGCELAKFLGLTVLVKNSDELNSKPSDCPILGEIPDEYGRLIDADELEKAAEKMVICDSYEYTIAHDMVKGLLKIAPTVLEASIKETM